MLADSVEATVRSMGKAERKALEKTVRNVIEEKFTGGQLSDCNLTTKDLKLIGDAFVRILEGVMHRRPSLFAPPGFPPGFNAPSIEDEEIISE